MHFYPTHRQFSEKETQSSLFMQPYKIATTLSSIFSGTMIISWKGLNKIFGLFGITTSYFLSVLRQCRKLVRQAMIVSWRKSQLLFVWWKPCTYISELSHIYYILTALDGFWFNSETTAEIQWVEEKRLLWVFVASSSTVST